MKQNVSISGHLARDAEVTYDWVEGSQYSYIFGFCVYIHIYITFLFDHIMYTIDGKSFLFYGLK